MLENKEVIEQIKQGEGFHTLSEQELSKIKSLMVLRNKSLQKPNLIIFFIGIILLFFGLSLLSNFQNILGYLLLVAFGISIGTEFIVLALISMRYDLKSWDGTFKRQIKRERKILERQQRTLDRLEKKHGGDSNV